ncbi:kruppel-like factor 11a [Stylonychia lemnae]|uniref:Kruppel-like factor 11a n=1 Tax=Stylonychia lemnae TaxID=5949 RepID=A0A078AHG1_STYLE|nr:kruppel-like factor 11a [Stylonychia lemnae]|eukprot:CDW81725.1 kruppel-like factor 11a [Stylonychia lemnae]
MEQTTQMDDQTNQKPNKCQCKCQCISNNESTQLHLKKDVHIQTQIFDQDKQTFEKAMKNDESKLIEETEIRKKLNLTDQEKIIFFHGEDLEPEQIPPAQNIPSLKTFKFVKIFQEKSKRWKSMFICTYDHCDIVLKKWGNIFDHLRIHCRERPFVCPLLMKHFLKNHGKGIYMEQEEEEDLLEETNAQAQEQPLNVNVGSQINA